MAAQEDHHDHGGHPEHSHLSDTDLRVRALESLLSEKGLVDEAALNAIVDTYENKVGPRNGARVVARQPERDGSDAGARHGAARNSGPHRRRDNPGRFGGLQP